MVTDLSPTRQADKQTGREKQTSNWYWALLVICQPYLFFISFYSLLNGNPALLPIISLSLLALIPTTRTLNPYLFAFVLLYMLMLLIGVFLPRILELVFSLIRSLMIVICIRYILLYSRYCWGISLR